MFFDFEADVALRYAVNGVEHGYFLVKQLGLVLGIVANLNIMADFEISREGDFSHNTFHQR